MQFLFGRHVIGQLRMGLDFRDLWRRYWFAVVAGVVCCVVMGMVYSSYVRMAHRERRATATGLADARFVGLMDDLRRYEEALTFTRGYFQSSVHVNAKEWERYVRFSKLQERFPGVWGFGYVERVGVGGLDGFVEQMRGEGDEGFEISWHEGYEHIRPTGDSYVIKYSEPEERNRSAIGLDVSLNPLNRDVYDRAMETGDVQMSSPFVLKQMENEVGHLGVVMALGVYDPEMETGTVEQRRAALRGWAVISLNMDSFAGATVGSWGDTEDFRMRIGEIDGPLIGAYESVGMLDDRLCPWCSEAHEPILRTYSGTIGGREIEISMRVDPSRAGGALAFADFHETLKRADMALFYGANGSLVLVGFALFVGYARGRAHRIAGRMTASLRESERRQREFTYHAQRANRAKSVFLANMSHEIRTPMTAVLGYTELLEEMTGGHRDPEAMGDAVERISRAGSHLLMVVNDVLDLSKIESGKLPINPVECRIGEVLSEVVSTMGVRADERGLTLGVAFETAVPGRVVTDPYRVRQVLLNLVGNAIKFTDSGSVVIRVGVEEHGGKDRLVLSVCDTGRGIREDRLERLFHPYEQEGDALGRADAGTGLGLSISRCLAEMMGGGLEARSVVGEGSVFTCWLPLVVGESVAGPEMIDRLPCGSRPGSVSGGGDAGRLVGRVLVAEDGEDNQRLLGHFLGKAGLEVEFVWNGREVIERFEADPGFDLIVLDMQMPVMEGYEAAELLRARGCGVPILALTANALSGDRQRCLASGCDEYETKPVNRARLLRTIGRMLEGSRGGGKAAA